jgi:lauroyl/myristoyl acyltransferase
MNFLLTWMARILLTAIRLTPLPVIARLGRAVGALCFVLDRRHRRVALANLHACFGAEKSPTEIHVLAQENFRRIGENFACAARTAYFTAEEFARVVDIRGLEKLPNFSAPNAPKGCIFALGHFGNFELFARFPAPHLRRLTTYRGLRQPGLDQLLQSMRERSGCEFLERRRDGRALRAALEHGGCLVGLLADQHAGDRGLRVPFLGRDASTSTAPAVFALRYHCALYVAACFRTGLGRWRLEVRQAIPTHDEHGSPRSVLAITTDINRALESAVRVDPANWFWVHNRWKSPGQAERLPQPDATPFPAA